MKAFVSYSHEDAELLQKLTTHLAVLRREHLLETWTDQEIHAGGVIDHDVAKAMEESHLFLLLVSASFIHSDYCYAKEFARALERHEAGEVRIVPIIVRECDWMIPELRKFKALPTDGRAVLSRHWHSVDEAFADVTSGLRALLEKPPARAKPRRSPPVVESFVPDDRHVTAAQRAELRQLHAEIVERLSAKAASLPEAEFKKARGKWFGILWSQFNEHFGTLVHGLQSLPREKFEDGKSWLLQYRASKDRNFKGTNPQKFRNTLTKTIYTIVGNLGWSKPELYAFASEKLGYPAPISSLDDLGNNQLEIIRDRVRYEVTKRKAKVGQANARRAGSVNVSGKAHAGSGTFGDGGDVRFEGGKGTGGADGGPVNLGPGDYRAGDGGMGKGGGFYAKGGDAE